MACTQCPCLSILEDTGMGTCPCHTRGTRLMQRNLILMRDVTQPLDHADEPRGQFIYVQRATDPGATELEAFCTAHRFPPAWVTKMLALGAQAWLLMQDGQAIATGWLVREPF